MAPPLQTLFPGIIGPQTNPYITLYAKADVEKIANCTYDGSIIIDPIFQGDMILPNLQSINGGVVATSTTMVAGNLTGLIFPKLEKVVFDVAMFQGVSALFLTYGIRVANISSLQTISLPQLNNYTGALVIQNLPGLTSLSDLGHLIEQIDYSNTFEVSYTNISSFAAFVSTIPPPPMFR